MRGWTWVAALGIVASIAFRIDLAIRFPADYTWDVTHVAYVRHLIQHHDIPREDTDPMGWGNVYYHPPLFYLIAAIAGGGEATYRAMKSVNVAFGFLRLAIFALALWLLFPAARAARSFALALHGIVPIAAQVDVSIANESSAATLALLAVFLSLISEREGARRPMLWSALAGIAAGLAFLCKITGALALSGPLAVAILWPTKRRMLRTAIALGAFLIVASPYLISNVSRYGRPLTKNPMALRGDFKSWKANHRLSEYRPISWFVLPPTPELLAEPHYPNAKSFWGALYVWTWGDYEGHLSYRADRGFGTVAINDKRVDARGFSAMQRTLYAALPCSLIAFFGTIALFAAALLGRMQRQPPSFERIATVGALVPAILYVLFLMAFAWFYPFDQMGMVKAAYVLGGVPIFCAAGGFACAWLWQRFPRARVPIALAIVAPALTVLVQRIVW